MPRGAIRLRRTFVSSADPSWVGLLVPRLLGIALAVLLCSCASQFQNDIFFTPGVDFAAMKSLAFIEKGGGTPANREIARQEIQSVLEGKGFRFTAKSGADLLVHYTLGTRAKVRLSGMSTEGTDAGLVVIFIDPNSQEPLWHGLTYESWYDSMDPPTEIRNAVQTILAQFPPPAS